MILCDYGCGQEGKYQFKNGKWCCSKHYGSCLSQRKRNSSQIKKAWEDPNSIYNSISWKKNQRKGIQKAWEDPILKLKEKQGKRMKEEWKDPNSIYNSDLYRKSLSDGVKEVWKNPLHKENMSNIIKEIWRDPDSVYNLKSYRENRAAILKEMWEDPDSIFNSISRNEKIGKSLRLTIEQITKKYPFFSKIEEMRYNPDKPGEEEIQGHCKNHNCKNSKEKDGWFTLTRAQIGDRIISIENPQGIGESNFYCSQYCKDTCFLYRRKSDPFKNTTRPYTYQENQLWRQIVLELDKGLCQFCGKPATDVHHIKPVKTHPHLALDPDNGISFCKECHYKIGHKTGTECSTGNLSHKQQQDCVLGGQN